MDEESPGQREPHGEGQGGGRTGVSKEIHVLGIEFKGGVCGEVGSCSGRPEEEGRGQGSDLGT